MTDPKNFIRSERDRLVSAVAGMDSRTADRTIEEKFNREAVALEKARVALVEAQRKNEQSHSWDRHFDALGR